MGTFIDILGIIGQTLGLNMGAVQIKEDTGSVKFRNEDDSDYINIKIKDAVAYEDAVTKKDLNEAVAGASGVKRVIRYALGTTTASSTTEIPANAYVFSVTIDVTTAYDAGTTVAIGQTGDTDLLMATSKNKATKVGTYVIPYYQGLAWGASSLAVLATVAGSPSAGASVIAVEYAVPNN